MLLWCATIVDPRSGAAFHFSLKFGKEYPKRPPLVTPRTNIYPHQNVFGDSICLDLLEQGEWAGHAREATFCGWSTAYSVKTLLLQLQSFLFSDRSLLGNYGDEDGDLSPQCVQEARGFRCSST